MENRINGAVRSIEMSGIRKFNSMIVGERDVISLAIGEPDFQTPKRIKAAAIIAIEDNRTRYTHNAGLRKLRELILAYVKKRYDQTYCMDEVIVTTGASEAIDVALRTILEVGDEVIIPVPTYPGYEPIVRMCGATPVYLDTNDDDFRVTADRLKSLISKKTKCLILPNPANPTGLAVRNDELKKIAEIVRENQIFVVSDEIYREIIYGDKYYSISSFARDETIVINGLSKSHAMTGWRIGFVLAPKEICKHILKVHQYNVACASTISQHAAIEAFSSDFDDTKAMRDAYLKRRDYTYRRLCQMNLETTLPDGAFYFLVKIPNRIKLSSFDFCVKFAQENKVAVVPGSSFSEYGEGYFRLSFATSLSNIEEGLKRLEKFIMKEAWD